MGVIAIGSKLLAALRSVIETSSRGGVSLAVTLQDQTTGILHIPFLRPILATTLAEDTVVGSYQVTLSTGHGLTTIANEGHVLELADPANGSYFIQGLIQTVVGDVVTIGSPISRIFPSATTLVGVGDSEMNVDGSSTPVVFSVTPLPHQSGDMTRIICDMRDNVDMDFETFGGLAELTNGIVLRVNNGDGTYRNLYTWRSNGDITEACYDVKYQINNGGGTRGLTARLTWAGQNKHGAAIRLDGSLGTGESLEFLVQDNLLGLLKMNWSAQGSELQGD